MKSDKEELKFGGIQTFMKSPYISLEEIQSYDVGVLGIPVDHGTSYRQGARNAPRAIRDYSHWDRVDGSEYTEADSDSTLTSNNLRIGDLGDVLISPGNADKTNLEILRLVELIRRGIFPLIIGGDHSLTHPSFIGCKKALTEAEKPIGILKFDAHPDVEEDYLTLPEVWHGNAFRKLMDAGQLDGNHLVNIGLRGLLPRKWMDYMRSHGVTNFTVPEIKKRGIDQVIQDSIKILRERCASVYVTFDIDCIDPADAPGTGTPSFGGIRAEEAIRAVRQLRDLPVKAFDLVEVNPDFDTTGRTQVAACDLLWNFLSFGLKLPNSK